VKPGVMRLPQKFEPPRHGGQTEPSAIEPVSRALAEILLKLALERLNLKSRTTA